MFKKFLCPIDKEIHVDVALIKSQSIYYYNCLQIHYVEGIVQRLIKDKNFWIDEYNYNDNINNDINGIKNSSGNSVKNINLNKKNKNCAFCVKSVYLRMSYIPDALIRHAFFRLINEIFMIDEKNIDNNNSELCCQAICQYQIGNDNDNDNNNICSFSEFNELEVNQCSNNYKFSLSMENVQSVGCITEKIYNSLLSDNVIPIYFGSTNIDNFINSYCSCESSYDSSYDDTNVDQLLNII